MKGSNSLTPLLSTTTRTAIAYRQRAAGQGSAHDLILLAQYGHEEARNSALEFVSVDYVCQPLSALVQDFGRACGRVELSQGPNHRTRRWPQRFPDMRSV